MVLEVKPDTLRKVNMIRRAKVALRKLGKVKDYGIKRVSREGNDDLHGEQ